MKLPLWITAVFVCALSNTVCWARVAGVIGAVQHSELVVAGRLEHFQGGTLTRPERRTGRLAVEEVFKGSPDADRLNVRLPDGWGPPSIQARMRTPSFWILTVCLALILSLLIQLARGKIPPAKLKLVLLLLPIIVGAVFPQFFSPSPRIEDWAFPPSDLRQVRLWTLRRMDSPPGRPVYTGYPYPLSWANVDVNFVMANRDSPLWQESGKATRECLMKIHRYLGRSRQMEGTESDAT